MSNPNIDNMDFIVSNYELFSSILRQIDEYNDIDYKYVGGGADDEN